MFDIPKQSKEGLQQLAIDVKTKLQGKPLSEAPLVLSEPINTFYHHIKLLIFVYICGMFAGIGYLLVTNPQGFLTWFTNLWLRIMELIH